MSSVIHIIVHKSACHTNYNSETARELIIFHNTVYQLTTTTYDEILGLFQVYNSQVWLTSFHLKS